MATAVNRDGEAGPTFMELAKAGQARMQVKCEASCSCAMPVWFCCWVGHVFRATLMISHRLDFVEQWSSLARTHLLDWPAQLQRSVSLIPTLFVGRLLDALFGMGDAVYLKSDCDVGVCVIIVVVCCPLASLHSLSSCWWHVHITGWGPKGRDPVVRVCDQEGLWERTHAGGCAFAARELPSVRGNGVCFCLHPFVVSSCYRQRSPNTHTLLGRCDMPRGRTCTYTNLFNQA